MTEPVLLPATSRFPSFLEYMHWEPVKSILARRHCGLLLSGLRSIQVAQSPTVLNVAVHLCVFEGASMAVGNGYASRVNALHERTQGRDQYLTPREQTAPWGGGNRYYPGSEKIHGPQHDRYESSNVGYGGHDQEYAGARTAPAGRWRR